MIEIEAYISHANGHALFKIRRENPGIYLADLHSYEGDLKQRPPKIITLIRGVRCWTGSHSNEILLNKLGAIIENHLYKTQEADVEGL